MPSATSLPSSAAQPARSGLFKRLTSKLRTPHPPPTPSTSAAAAPAASESISKPKRGVTIHLPKPKAPAPSYPNAFTSAEHRDAALRARGLVPRRYRDPNGDTIPMSAQEAEHDQRFSMLVDEPGSSEGSDGESEAKRIREAWLQRNAAADVAPRASSELGSVEEDDELVIATPAAPRRPRVVEALPLSPSQAALHGGTSGLGQSGPDAVDPARVPLPASPLSSRRGTTSTPVPVTNGASVDVASELGELVQGAGTPAADPPTAAAPVQPADATQAHPESAPAPPGSCTKDAQSPLPPLPSTPSSSSSSETRSPRTLTLPTLTVSPSTPRASIEQNMPALSPTRTTSSTTTSDAPHTPQPADDVSRMSLSSSDSGHARTKLTTALARPGKLSSTLAAVIVESPVEDDEPDHVPELPAAPRRTGLFKRGGSAHSTPEKTPRPSASLGNLRRSVTSSLAGRLRPRSALVVDTARPPAPAPASPPSAASSSPTSARTTGSLGAGPRPRRQPLSPTMHSRGSILLQAREIEDEESRRLSEAAFLDF